jgi:ADP-ribose pyrophosphatase YjhB (NUDIX family)
MAAVPPARRHLNELCSDLAAEYGEVDLLHERVTVPGAEYERLRERAAGDGHLGGAGAWVRDGDRKLLVRYAEGWAEPGTPGRPGEDHEACARRAVADQTGLAPDIQRLSHVHVRHVTTAMRSDAVPQPFVVFEGTAAGDPEAGPTVEDAAWHTALPENLLYDALADLLD